MATEIIMPALGMAQETGQLVSWLKHEGDQVTKGEPLMEIETDKATVEIEAPASGTLSQVSAHEGDVVPVGRTIAMILAPDEISLASNKEAAVASRAKASDEPSISPLARKVAEEHNIDLELIKPVGGRITKDDVLAYLAQSAPASPAASLIPSRETAKEGKLIPASPKARRLAAERQIDLAAINGSGPGGAVIAADIPDRPADVPATASAPVPAQAADQGDVENLGTIWRVMAERMTASWTSAPHFFLMREVKAAAMIEMRQRILPAVEKRSGIQPTYTDLLVKLVAVALRDHPRLNASWAGNGIHYHPDINIGLAVGIEEGLVVPVIHQADTHSIGELATQRRELVDRAKDHRLRPPDISDGTFTITNLGMYNVDAFLAVLNPPQAAILAVGRIADHVVPEKGQPVVRPEMVLTLSCDHRVVDGVRAAKFLDDLTNLIEEPWGVLA